MKLHHIGIACKDIHKGIKDIKRLHTVSEESVIVYDEKQNAYLCFLKIENNIGMELISGKQVENLLKKGISYYHVCYTVGNIKEKIAELLDKGATLVSPPKPAKLFNLKKVGFLYTSYGLIELLEE